MDTFFIIYESVHRQPDRQMSGCIGDVLKLSSLVSQQGIMVFTFL